MTVAKWALLALLIAAVGCGSDASLQPAQGDGSPRRGTGDMNAEAAPASTGQTAPSDVSDFEQIVLLDVQGLFGGRDIWIAGDGTVTCRLVRQPRAGETGLQEECRRFALSPDQRRAIVDVLAAQDFLTIATEQRFGVPDEARPAIYVKTPRTTHAVAKWANDQHPRFDAVYKTLTGLAEHADGAETTSTGPYDMDWAPEGFSRNREIWTLTAPDLEKK